MQQQTPPSPPLPPPTPPPLPWQPQPPWIPPPQPVPLKWPWSRHPWVIPLAIGVGALVLLGLLVALVAPWLYGAPPALATVTPVATAAGASATVPRSGPHLVTGATIGGTQAAFTAHYGSPGISTAGTPSYLDTVNGIAVQVDLSALSPGVDGVQRVAVLSLADPTGTSWAAYTGDLVVPAFFPPDARHVRDDQDPNLGTLHVYQSAELAVTFPASAFTNSNGGGVEPPGTFTANCAPPGTDSCTISLGE